MSRVPGLKRILRIERDGAGVERAVDDELQFHFEMTMRELMSSGMTPDEARREATRRFGDVQRTRERLTTTDRSRLGRERRTEWVHRNELSTVQWVDRGRRAENLHDHER